MHDGNYSYIYGWRYTAYRKSDKFGKTWPFWNPENSKNLLMCKNSRFDISFPRAIILILGNVEIVTYAFTWSLGRGRPKKVFFRYGSM